MAHHPRVGLRLLTAYTAAVRNLPSLFAALVLFFVSAAVLPAPAAAQVPVDSLDEPAGQKPREIVYKTIGDTRLILFNFAPEGLKPGDSRPAVVCIHGGGWAGGTPQLMFAHARYFATRGAVGFSVQYRLLGKDMNVGPTVMDCIADCNSAVRYIRKHAAELGVDPQRIAVTGDSAGGHLAACLGTTAAFNDTAEDLTVSGMANAVMLFNPVADLTGRWKDRLPVGPDQAMLARAVSPVYQIAPDQPPALLMHGDHDTVVDPEQAIRYAAAMWNAGNRCDFELIPGAKHAFVLPFYYTDKAVSVAAIVRADVFLNSLGWLEGEPTIVVGK